MESILFCLFDQNAYLWLTRALREHLMSEEVARNGDESDRMAEKEQLRLRWDIKESTCTQQIS